MKTSCWEKYYGKMPLDQIPWQRTRADWFKHSVDSGVVKGKTALDLGCGTGKKSIYLAQNGFEKVIGVDISPSAIKYAKENANKDKTKNNTEFFVHDVTNLAFLGDQKFDFILDWAVLHCIEEDKREDYISQIVEHSNKESLFMLRVFSDSNTGKDYFIDTIDEETSKVSLFNRDLIDKLFVDYFTIIEHNRSQPRTKDNLCFIEFLMRKK